MGHKIILNNRLNIFVDETGEFGFTKKSAKQYGVSLVCHEQTSNIQENVSKLTDRLEELNFYSMIHMGELVTGHGAFENMSIAERRKIYMQLHKFATTIDAKYYSIFLDKKIYSSAPLLKNALERELQAFVLDKLDFFQYFDEIKVYYDGGQKQLSVVIDNVFGKLGGYNRETDFDHTEKKLFQVADMLTYVDKLLYKYNHNMKLTNTEKGFFNYKTINKVERELRKHRFYKK